MTEQKTKQGGRYVPDPPVAASALERPSIPLGEGAAQGEIWERFMGNLVVRNITQARLFPFLPAPDQANGETVLILPGGGHQMVSLEHEGFALAARLVARGYAAYVLAYRTRPTPADRHAFFAEMGAQFRKLGKSPPLENPAAVTDLGAAIAHLLNAGAAQVSVLGFSAGARTILRYLEASPPHGALSDIGLIYPPMSPVDRLGSDARIFIAAAADDPLVRACGVGLISGLLEMGKCVEFHLYEAGGHGFGMARTGGTTDGWSETYLTWLSKRRKG